MFASMRVMTYHSALGAGLFSIALMSAAGEWISTAEAVAADAAKKPIALQFRRDVAIPANLKSFSVRISADQRFVLYVNGRRVAAGPARGDLQSWRYERIDLAPYLKRGINVIAAQVWSDGKWAPLAQISAGATGFYIEAENSAQAQLIDSNTEWRVRVDASRTVTPGLPQMVQQIGGGYYVAGAPEKIDAALQAADWSLPTSSIADWQNATPISESSARRQMVADALPQMRYDKIASGRVVRTDSVNADVFPGRSITIPAHAQASVLIDAGHVLAAYPVLRVSQGAGAEVKLTYAEALYDPSRRKGGSSGSWARFTDRARVDDGLARGLTDTFKPDGSDQRRFEPFWWRVWRFVEIKITTADQPLVLEGFDTMATGYPFEQRGRFVSDDAQLNEIWQIGWRTAQVDAHETYMDSAYWEQLQYIGDTRIQMLLSYDVAGDPRLAVQALDAFDSSRKIKGMPQAAWPASNDNFIPPFALFWIGALHDYWMHQPDTAVVTKHLDGMRVVLDWYAPYLHESGAVGPTPGWRFVDGVSEPELDGWAARNTSRGPENCAITLIYYGALHEAAELEDATGDARRAMQDRAQAERVKQGLSSQCWDAERGLYANTPEKNSFSQHVNALAVLYNVVPPAQQKQILEKIISGDDGIAPPAGITGSSFYFSFYLARALDHAGLSDRYIDLLQSWRKLLGQNFTTWPEYPDPSRSDTHAWSGHPTSGLLAYVAGIQPAAPGFAKVRVAPHLGMLTKLDAAMAHPQGLIETMYKVEGTRLNATVKLPKGVTGEFEWKGQMRPLQAGVNRLIVEAP